MLLASPLLCDNPATNSYRTPLFSPLPLSSRQRTDARPSIPLSIQRTCNALQSLLAGATPQTQSVGIASNTPVTITNGPAPRRSQESKQNALLQNPAPVNKPGLAPTPTRHEMQKRRASRLPVTTTHNAPVMGEHTLTAPTLEKASRPTTPPPAPRGANKRRRSDSDDASRLNDSQSLRAPSTPKRQRKLPADLPQGLKEADFDAIHKCDGTDAAPLSSCPQHPAMLLRRRSSHQDERTIRQVPSRVLQRPAHHRRASSSAMMSLFFTTLQLDTSVSIQPVVQQRDRGKQQQRESASAMSDTGYEHQRQHSLTTLALDTAALEHPPNHAVDSTATTITATTTQSIESSTAIDSSSLLLKSWEDSQLEQISRGMAVRGRMRIRRPRLGGRAERKRVDGMGWVVSRTAGGDY